LQLCNFATFATGYARVGGQRTGRQFQARRNDITRAATRIPAFAGTTWASARTFSFPPAYSNSALRLTPGYGTTSKQTNMFSVYQKDNSEIPSADELAFGCPRRRQFPRQSREAVSRANLG
jgi:hypothetical protein